QVAEIQKRLSPWQRWRRGHRAASFSRRLPQLRSEWPSQTGTALFAGSRARVLIGLASAAVVLIAVFAVVGFSPGSRGTEGAIGDGTEARTEPPDLQRFLQSESWGRLKKNDAMRAEIGKIVSDPALASALSRPVVAATLERTDFAAALSSQGAAGVLGDNRF